MIQLRDEVQVAQVYSAFKDLTGDGNHGDTKAVLESLDKYSQIYRYMDSSDGPELVRRFLQRMKALDIRSVDPLIMEVLANLPDEDPCAHQIFQDIESFLIRRMVCQLSTRGYNKLFAEVTAVISGDAANVAASIRSKLVAKNMRKPTGGRTTRNLVMRLERQHSIE